MMWNKIACHAVNPKWPLDSYLSVSRENEIKRENVDYSYMLDATYYSRNQ